ncbi:YcaO-like family protein [Bdellovibrionota bacterium FG-1]
MKTGFSEIISAHANSPRFNDLVLGTSVTLPTGQILEAKVENLELSIRPQGLRLSKFAYTCDFRVGDHLARGFGEAEHKLIAVQKCLAEGFERAVFRSLKGTAYHTPNSNGWAAHLNPTLVQRSGLEELLERDAILVHWLTQTPMTEVQLDQAPAWLSQWINQELPQGAVYKTVRILISTTGYLPSVTTVLFDQNGYAVMSHATASTLERAVYKALVETCRIAQLAIEGYFFDSAKQLAAPSPHGPKTYPEDHAMVYAHHERFPAWIFGQSYEWTQAARAWQLRHKVFSADTVPHQYHAVVSEPLSVGYCTSEQIQNLYFGRTEVAQEKGLINVRRLESVRPGGSINLLPHCVA